MAIRTDRYSVFFRVPLLFKLLVSFNMELHLQLKYEFPANSPPFVEAGCPIWTQGLPTICLERGNDLITSPFFLTFVHLVTCFHLPFSSVILYPLSQCRESRALRSSFAGEKRKAQR